VRACLPQACGVLRCFRGTLLLDTLVVVFRTPPRPDQNLRPLAFTARPRERAGWFSFAAMCAGGEIPSFFLRTRRALSCPPTRRDQHLALVKTRSVVGAATSRVCSPGTMLFYLARLRRSTFRRPLLYNV